MPLRTVVILALLATTAHAAFAQSSEHRVIRRTTAPGREIRIFTYTQHRSDCFPASPPLVAIQTGPTHGTVSIRPGSVVSGPPRFGGVDCTGTTLPGTSIYYTPQPGFQGADQFDYTVTNANGRAQDTAVIDVH